MRGRRKLQLEARRSVQAELLARDVGRQPTDGRRERRWRRRQWQVVVATR